MGCGCGGNKSGLKYEVVKADGSRMVVNTLSEAQAIVRRTGGTFRAITV